MPWLHVPARRAADKHLRIPSGSLESIDVPDADSMLAVAASRRDQLKARDFGPRPRRKLAVLAGMDVRIDLFTMLGLARGDAHIIRNAGGLVTDDALRSLSASQRLLGTEEIVVVMHEDCGLHSIADADLGAFDDLEMTLRDGLGRLRSSSELPTRDQIRGFVFDPESGALRDVERTPDPRSERQFIRRASARAVGGAAMGLGRPPDS